MAIDARAAATGRQVGEKERLKKLDQASTLEEEAENYRREAGRLRAEASQLDEELAREMDEHGDGQTSGVISY
jgi:predicted nuclease with TOPRIM domain